MKTIWSFDLGKASIGEAVRDLKDDSFPHAESLLIPELFADTKPAASRRRMWRTRIAHHAREEWLAGIMRLAGFEPLRGRRMVKAKDGWRQAEESAEDAARRTLLEREFPTQGDGTQYNSAALRILLLRAEPGNSCGLQEWQIFKALRSAIQKRGYGRVPWAAREARRSVGKSEEEMDVALLAKNESKLTDDERAYRAAIKAWPDFRATLPEDCRFPCYYDAARMEMWSAANPGVVKLRQDCHAGSTRQVRFAREDVEREIATLAKHAVEQWPALRAAFTRIRAEGWRYRENATGRERMLPVIAETFGEFLVHGPGGAPSAEALSDFHRYLEERRARGLRPGTEDDWQGATGQKTPRFDNRIVEDCGLLDGLRVCGVGVRFDAKTKAIAPESLLYAEVTFLMKLKNTRIHAGGGQPALSIELIRYIFDLAGKDARAVAGDAKDWNRKVTECFSMSKTDWARRKELKPLALRPLPGHEEIKAPKSEGRSRFSRPALRLLRALLLSGQKPSVFRARLLAREPALLAEIGMDVLDAAPVRSVGTATVYVKSPRPWILVSHLKFLADLARVNDTWEGIHIPEQRLDALEARHSDTQGHVNREAAVEELIGSVNDPIVRHRLGVFRDRLTHLEKNYGTPEQIVLEFIREDFMGPKAKGELFKFQNERERMRKDSREKAAEAGASGKMAGLKFELLTAQAGLCLYCGQSFAPTSLDDYRVEHIVPRAQNGPDAVVNYVLAHEHCNDAKADMTPHQWMHGKEGWDCYVKRVEARATYLRNKKVQLLTREDAAELVQRYTALAETAWISRLAQTISGLWFGWRNGNDDAGNKRVIVIAGGLTARVRRRYKLNSLLNKPPVDCADVDAWEEQAEKNRADDRHHALDAMVINFLPQWTRSAKKEHFFRFPAAIHANARGFFEKRLAAVTPHRIVRERAAMEETFYGKRELFGETFMVKRRPLFGLATKEEKGKVKIKPRKDIKTQKIVDGAIRRVVEEFLETQDELTLEAWTAFCAQARCGANGPRIVQMLMTETEPDAVDEYGNFSKAGTAARGQYRRAASHAGYFILTRPAPTKQEPEKRRIEVRPVFAFQSERDVNAALRAEQGVEIVDYFWSNCQVVIAKVWEFKGETFPPGEYTLKTLWAQGNAVLKHGSLGMIGAKPKHNAPIPLWVLVAAGIKRAGK